MSVTSDAVVRVGDLQISMGKAPLIDGLSFEVLIGEIFGMASHDKTLVKALTLALTGFIAPQKGTIRFAGLSSPETGRKEGKISWYLSDMSFPAKMTVEEILLFSGSMRGMNSKLSKEKAEELTGLFGLTSLLRQRWDLIGSSVRQKVSIVTSLMTDAAYMVMDYIPPIEGDFESLVRNYLVASTGIGKTIIICTDRPEGFCDRALVVRDPRTFEVGPPDSLKVRALGYGTTEIVVRGLQLPAVEAALMRAECSWHYIGEDRLAILAPGSPTETNYVIAEIFRNGGTIEEIKSHSPDFKDILTVKKED